MNEKLKVERLLGFTSNHLSNTASIDFLVGKEEIELECSLIDLKDLYLALQHAIEVEEETLSPDEIVLIPFSPIEPTRLLSSSVKLRMAGRMPYLELRLNEARPSQVVFVMSVEEGAVLGESLVKEAGKLLPYNRG